MNTDRLSRFSARVPYYHQYRPRYPRGVITLMEDLGLTAASLIADIGSGTGISAELFLDYGATVYAVEPNAEMRAAAETYYSYRPNFRPVNGTAEATTLDDSSVNFVTAGQAFHWFDHAKTKAEFMRILKVGGWVVLFWNDRGEDVTPFLADYNRVVTAHDIEQGNTPRAKELISQEDDLAAFFAPNVMHKAEIANPVDYDWEALKGRALSASYMPLPGHPLHEPMVAALREVYDKHQSDGVVRMDYITRAYWGRLVR